MDFNSALEAAGNNGLYQFALFALASVMTFATVDSFIINFLAGRMNHWCYIPDLNELPAELQRTIAVPMETVGETQTYSSCSRYSVEYTRTLYGMYNSSLDDATMGWNRSIAMNGYNVSHADVTECESWSYDHSVFISTIVSRWDLVCDRKWLIDLVSTIYMAGRLLACIICGPLSDRFGRKPAIFVFHGIKMLGSVMSIYAPNYELFVTSRFIIAFGSTASTLVFFVLMSEVIGEKYRHVYGVGWNTMISVGGMALPAFAYFVREYTYLQNIYTWPQFAIFATILIVDESPRWLMSRGRHKDAIKVLRRIAAVNGRPAGVVHDDDDEAVSDKNGHALIEKVDSNGAVTETEKKDDKKLKNGTLLDLLSSATLRKYSIVLWLNWFTDALMYYALSLNTGRLPGDIFINTFLLMAVEIPANLLTIYLCGRIGRKLTLVVCTCLAGVTAFLMIPFMFFGGVEVMVTIFALLGKAFITMSYSAIYVITAEIYPTCFRAVGLGTSASFARLSGMGASFVGGYLNDMWRPLPALIFGILGVVSGSLMVLLPETKSKFLPDTIDEAEAMGKTQNGVHKADKTDKKEKELPEDVCDFESVNMLDSTTEAVVDTPSRPRHPLVSNLQMDLDLKASQLSLRI